MQFASVKSRFMGLAIALLVGLSTAGCGRAWLNRPWFGSGGLFNDPNRTVSQILSPNPASVVIADHEFAWNQIVDEIDNYFKIKKEERIRVEEGIITEGVITTYPTSGSTLLEPWRADSTPGFEKLHATFHAVRRTAKVRVIPSGATYLVEVVVTKEMEDLANPENATVGHSIRHNIATRLEQDGADVVSQKARWYSVGRDTSLEQKILVNIQNRLKTN